MDGEQEGGVPGIALHIIKAVYKTRKKYGFFKKLRLNWSNIFSKNHFFTKYKNLNVSFFDVATIK